jgi:putative membrane protein
MEKEERKAINEEKRNRSNALAIDRTILANERTLLAYLRTSLTLMVAGISFLHFTTSIYVKILSWIFIPAGIIIIIYGFRDFKKRIQLIEKGRNVLRKDVMRVSKNSPDVSP